ncbi:MAG: MCE family protein [Alphaproteobacteria bacterium]|nr:MCE family protein [Alphaproteobacteria bacterium]
MNKTYKLTGLFVLIGIICFSGIIGYFIKQKYSARSEDMLIMYFDESVRGLSVGSPVVLQGVEVGKVAKIRLITNLEKGTFKTPVYMIFNDDGSTPERSREEYEVLLKNLIEKGLRARLITSNFLTGQLMIELVMLPNDKPVYRGSGKYPEIPTVYSSFAQISKDLEDVPLQDTIIRVGHLIDNIDESIPIILKDISQTASTIKATAPDVMKNLSDLAESLNKNIPSLLANLSDVSKKVNSLMDEKTGSAGRTLENMNKTLEDISKASRSLKNLTDYLERHPEAVIQGKEK